MATAKTAAGSRTRVVVGGSFACDDALARPLHALLDAVIGDGAVHVDWLSYGSLSELSQWLQVVAPDPESSSTGGAASDSSVSHAVDLLVLLVRVSDLEAAHPELQSSTDVVVQEDSTANSLPADACSTIAILSPPLLDAFARDLETYVALLRDRPPVVVLFCPPPPLLAGRHAQHEQKFAQRLGRSVSHVVEVLPSSHLHDLYEWHYCKPDETQLPAAYYDAVSDHREHAPFTWRMQRVLALAICRHVRRVFLSPAKAKKCIVLDCDNTLWGGAVAEVGALALNLSPRFVALQRFVLEQQRARGLVLCLCSKNIHADVDAAFWERRDDMPLKMDKHIAATKIDWASKSHNIRAIADELSLGLDSFVFIDDNPVECSEVASALPMVTVIHLPEDFTPLFLHHEWVFDTPLRRLQAPKGTPASPSESTTEEDRERTRFYQQNREREQLRHEVATPTAFLSSLGIRIEFDELSSSADNTTGSDDRRRQTMTRVLQLHHRTNQFNPTTTFSKRLEAAQLDEYVAHSGRYVLCARVTDRFGHYGLVSAVLCRRVDDDGHPTLQVNSFLLSCRALNRGVEHAVMRKVAAIARRVEATRILFDWEPTERNQPAQLFFASMPDAVFTPEPTNGKNASDANLKSKSATKDELTPAISPGQWMLSVEAASRVAFLKTVAPTMVSTPSENAAKPLVHQVSSPLMTVTSLISLWWTPVLHFTQNQVARAFRVLVFPLLPRWLVAQWELPLKRVSQTVATTVQPFAETPFRTRGSLERFLSSKLSANEDHADSFRTDTPSAEAMDHNELSKFRRKARYHTKLALLDHLREENPAVVWSANRRVDGEVATAPATANLTCETPSCRTRVPRKSACAFQRCRNCCYRIQRLLHRVRSPEAHAAARMSAQTTLKHDFGLTSDTVVHLITGKQQTRELPRDGFCPAHRNKRRMR